MASRKISTRFPARSLVRFDKPVTHQRENRWRSHCEDDIDLEPDELGREPGEPIIACFRPAILDGDGVPDNPAKFA
jgi:hypothetical protein